MGQKYHLNSKTVQQEINEKIVLDQETGKIYISRTTTQEMSSGEISNFVETLKENKRKDGFDFNHAYLKDSSNCYGNLFYHSHLSDLITFKCEQCGEIILWHWEEFLRYFDCR